MGETYDLTYPAWPCPDGSLIPMSFTAMREHRDKVHQEHGDHARPDKCIRCIITDELTMLPVRCPDNHSVGMQNPLYQEGVATGEYECEVCHKVYIPLADARDQTGPESVTDTRG